MFTLLALFLFVDAEAYLEPFIAFPPLFSRSYCLGLLFHPEMHLEILKLIPS